MHVPLAHIAGCREESLAQLRRARLVLARGENQQRARCDAIDGVDRVVAVGDQQRGDRARESFPDQDALQVMRRDLAVVTEGRLQHEGANLVAFSADDCCDRPAERLTEGDELPGVDVGSAQDVVNRGVRVDRSPGAMDLASRASVAAIVPQQDVVAAQGEPSDLRQMSRDVPGVSVKVDNRSAGWVVRRGQPPAVQGLAVGGLEVDIFVSEAEVVR